MKQFIATGLAFVYLTALAGIPMNIHYCRGNLVSVGIFQEGEACCCHESVEMQGCCTDEMDVQTCSLDKKATCCSSEYFTIQYTEDKQIINNTINLRHGKDHALKPVIEVSEPEGDNTTLKYRDFDIPPNKPQPLYLLHCTLTFYG